MLRLVLRPLLVLLTLGALVVALVQVAGRVAMAVLDDLEPAVNQALAERGIRFTGLSGDWRMLNPILRADRVDLATGRLDGVEMELHMLESVLRGTPVARRLKVDALRLRLEKPDGEPWRFAGVAGGEAFDASAFITHSNQLELEGVVALVREGLAPAELRFTYLGTNRGGEHRHALELRNQREDCPGGCRLVVQYHDLEGLWPLRVPQTRITARADGFLLPKALLGLSPLQVAELDLAWQRDGDRSGGTMALAAEQFDMPGDVTLATRLAGSVRGSEGIHGGSVTDWHMRQGDEVWKLPDMAVNADPQGVNLWMPQLDLARAARFLQQALAGVGPAERWLAALDLRGQAHNLRGYYDFDGGGVGYALTLDQVAIEGFKGVPTVANASGELFGYGRGLQLNLNAQDMGVAFPEVFTGDWRLPYAQGVVQGWFGRDYFGIRGQNLRAEAFGSRAAGAFAVSRPPDKPGQRLSLLVSTDRIGVADAQRFIPYKLPDALRDWLEQAPSGGTLHQARVAYQGQFQAEPGERARRLELATRVSNGGLRYHEDWPAVTGIDGELAVAGSLVTMDMEQGMSGGARLDGSRVRVVDDASAVDVSLDAETGAAEALNLVRTTPLKQWLGFIDSDWQGSGPLRLSGELHVPLRGERIPAIATGGALEDELAVRLRADLQGVDVTLPGYRLAVDDLDGSFRYRFPHQVDAAGIRGRVFGEAVTLSAATQGDRVHLYFQGRGRPEHVWQLVDVSDPGVARGSFEYQADLGIPVDDSGHPELAVTASLQGTELDLPVGYGKPADSDELVAARVAFLPDHRTVSFEYRDAAGWLHVDDALLRGAIGFDGPAPAVPDDARELVLAGRLSKLVLDEVLPDRQPAGDVAGGGPGGGLGLPIRLDALAVDEVLVGDFVVHGARVNGEIMADGFALDVRSDEVVGHFAGEGDSPLMADLDRVTIHAADPADPADIPVGSAEGLLQPSLIAGLPDADVWIESLMLGEQDYGSWRFELRPVGDDLLIHKLNATVRGVEIDSPTGLVWHGQANETRFEGRLNAGNLAEVLPQWGYAPTVETQSATLSGAFTWPGSPAAVDLLALRGEARAEAADGRFLDVESGAGAQRIFSLLNFTAIAKRVTLNFSDVFGRGVSFDDLDAYFSLDDGLLRFLEPMQVEGTGSSFRVTGEVDLEARTLDSEMIVTLPVSKGLPWYAAYAALANPLVGLGVLVGERVLRKPIEQFSSARYRIGGTLDDPEVKFVSVFDVPTPEEEQAASADQEQHSE